MQLCFNVSVSTEEMLYGMVQVADVGASIPTNSAMLQYITMYL